jgi:hypothetical protein
VYMGQGSKRFFRLGSPPVIASFPIGKFSFARRDCELR